jgi:hypothetical protein
MIYQRLSVKGRASSVGRSFFSRELLISFRMLLHLSKIENTIHNTLIFIYFIMSSQLTSSLALSPVLGSPGLPALRRSPRRPRNAPTLPTLPKTNVYIFSKGLIRRTMLDTTPRSVLYNCTQPLCNYSKTMRRNSSC